MNDVETIFEDLEERLHQELFFPGLLERLEEILRTGTRFVHYTSAEAAMHVLRGRAIWMRNALTMNDYSEIEHGMKCLDAARASPAWRDLAGLIEQLQPGLQTEIDEYFKTVLLPSLQTNTFITSLSEHPQSEDDLGRLSMWRAYGQRRGVALVLNLTPFMANTNELAAYSQPVNYVTPAEYVDQFSALVANLRRHQVALATLERHQLFYALTNQMRFAALCTKHPGFREEREWRIVYWPTLAKSPAIEPDIQSVNGVPQIIQRIPLKNAPELGLVGADIPNLIHRIIIGPTPESFAVWQALVQILKEAGVDDAYARVHSSHIPLRH